MFAKIKKTLIRCPWDGRKKKYHRLYADFVAVVVFFFSSPPTPLPRRSTNIIYKSINMRINYVTTKITLNILRLYRRRSEEEKKKKNREKTLFFNTPPRTIAFSITRPRAADDSIKLEKFLGEKKNAN